MIIPPQIALVGWIPVVLGFFAFLSPRRAVIVSVVAGWLVLPVVTYRIEHAPDYGKLTAVGPVVLVAAALFDFRRLVRLRPRAVDLPMAVWCLSPFASSLSNGLGPYDGVSAVYEQSVAWGIPWVLGRAYLGDLTGLREYALGVLWGGLAYVPLGLVELFWGPELHHLAYGFYQHPNVRIQRLGGWRPAIFMEHGLTAAFWMTAASLIAVWLWSTGAVKRARELRLGWWAAILIATTLLFKALNASLLLGLGGGLLFLIRRHASVAVAVVTLAIPFYIAVRATGSWDGQPLIRPVRAVLGERAAESVNFRLINEELLAEKARERPLLGFGRWARSRIYDEQGVDVSKTDSVWIIAFGQYGAIGLLGWLGSLLGPVLAFWRRYPLWRWVDPDVAPAAVLAVILALYAIDSCFNALANPLYVLAGGGLAGLGVGGLRSVSE
ncbi:MAG TPA: O-antigen ligase domain-containing protein [Candidatus Methylomirabilis sp.]|nr:O-antigen ligase domain-containing protein [Candidatus Methylomirabilis sp.]